jgi:hypothetical protein
MDDVGVENSELEPQVPAPGPSGVDTPAEEPRLWDDVPVADDEDASGATDAEPGAETAAELEAEPGAAASEPEPVEAPVADPVEAAAVAQPVQPTLDEMVASIAMDAAASATEVAEDDGAAPAESVPADGAEDESGDGAAAASDEPAEAPADQTVSTEPVGESAATEPAEVAPEPDEAALEAVPVVPVPYAFRLRLRVPFWIEFAVFVAFVAAMVYLLWPASTGPFVTLPLYAVFVFGGAALVAVDLVTALVVWLSARSGATDDEKVGLGRTLWMRALAWTAGGVALWWIGIALLELHRTGLLG